MTHDEILSIIRPLLARHTGDPRLHSAPPAEVSLQSLGVPSVDMISLVIELEERFDRPLDTSRLHELRTLADLVAALE